MINAGRALVSMVEPVFNKITQGQVNPALLLHNVNKYLLLQLAVDSFVMTTSCTLKPPIAGILKIFRSLFVSSIVLRCGTCV